jgi:hypothetical protein
MPSFNDTLTLQELVDLVVNQLVLGNTRLGPSYDGAAAD